MRRRLPDDATVGAHNRNRTDDLVLTKDALCRLSYVSFLRRCCHPVRFVLRSQTTTREPWPPKPWGDCVERVAGIEPAPSAWKAEVLPLNYTRPNPSGSPGAPDIARPCPARADTVRRLLRLLRCPLRPRAAPSCARPPLPAAPARRAAAWRVVEGVGFEPTKAEPSDLQSDPFGHSGTPPGTQNKRRGSMRLPAGRVKTLRGQHDTRRFRSSTVALVPPQGVEPWTFSLQVSCSTGLSYGGG